ncbi:MAG: septum formation initiator family protein [Verrucomicrobiota bacterium]
MNFWVLTYRIGWIALGILLVVALVSVFLPQIRQYQELRHREAVLQSDIRLEEEMLKHLKQQQERLQSDPRFVERIAREELGYAKPGETVFKFLDDAAPTNRSQP